MTRGKSKFRQRDVARAIKAARSAGVEVADIEINTDGKIVVHVGAGAGNPAKLNSADAVLEQLQHERKS